MIHGSYLEVLGAPVVEVDTKACVHLHKVMLSCCLKCQVTGGRLHGQSWTGKICGTTTRQMGDLESSLFVARFTSRPRAEALLSACLFKDFRHQDPRQPFAFTWICAVLSRRILVEPLFFRGILWDTSAECTLESQHHASELVSKLRSTNQCFRPFWLLFLLSFSFYLPFFSLLVQKCLFWLVLCFHPSSCSHFYCSSFCCFSCWCGCNC